jgi:hypothetical protein
MKDDNHNYSMMKTNCSPCKCPRIYYRNGNTSSSASQEQYRRHCKLRINVGIGNPYYQKNNGLGCHILSWLGGYYE